MDTLDSQRMDPNRIEVMDDDMAEVFRSMTGAQRLEVAFGMIRSARNMLTHHLRTEHPDWDNEQIQQEVASRFLRGDT